MAINKPKPPLRKASTVILVRPGHPSFEVYVLKRHVKSGFMGGYHVFPGGTVDIEDTDINTWSPHIDTQLEQVERHLGDQRISRADLIGFGIAAIRETLEECGVLLAEGNSKSSRDYESMTAKRLEPDLPKAWFKDRITTEKWTLSFSRLYRWSHWITPPQMKSRYDTRFFVAHMPSGQTCEPDNRETHQGLWLTPQSALEQNLDKTIALSPPTLATLTQMAQFESLEALTQALPDRDWGEPIMPRVVVTPDGPVILEPWDPLYDSDAPITIQNPLKKVLAPGIWFSRIWRDGNIWKPIGI